MITISEPPLFVSSLILFILSQIQKFPTKIAPKIFMICWCDEVLLDLIHGLALPRVDLAFPHHLCNFHPQNHPNFALELPFHRGVHRVCPRIQSPDIRPDRPDIRPPRTSGPQPGHTAPNSSTSIHRPVSRLTLAKFCSGAHVHFHIPPSLSHSTTAFRKHHNRLRTTNYDNFDTFCFENLSCGSVSYCVSAI